MLSLVFLGYFETFLGDNFEVDIITSRYAHIEQSYTLPLEYVATMIELFSKNEKLYAGAYMYRDLLRAIKAYVDGDLHYTEVLKAASPGFR